MRRQTVQGSYFLYGWTATKKFDFDIDRTEFNDYNDNNSNDYCYLYKHNNYIK